MKPAIRVENLSKHYHIGTRVRAASRNLTESILEGVATYWRKLTGLNRNVEGEDSFWALQDVSFEIQPGEVMGIIGRNGAGKSTLLKILSRIVEPTTGRVIVRGRMASLLEVGTGFHQELTGRENIYLNGSILGMSRREVARKFDEIVAFAEIDKFLDTPVKRYSSGMYVRLAFAVAAHLEPEILVIDEVLAVGDASFQRKCLGKIGEVASGGRTVLFVSHNIPTIRQLTDRCVYLHAGRSVCIDHTAAVLERYLEDSFTTVEKNPESLDYYRRENTSESVRFQQVRFITETEQEVETLQPGEAFRLEATVEAKEFHERACLTFWLTNERGERVSTFFSGDAGFWFSLAPGTQIVNCAVVGLPLSPGKYMVTLGIARAANVLPFDVLVDYPAFMVTLPGLDTGEIDWTDRPWGAVHWDGLNWSASHVGNECASGSHQV